MYQNVPNLRCKFSDPTITYRVAFAPQGRLSVLTSQDSWAPMSVRVYAKAAPLYPKPCREAQP